LRLASTCMVFYVLATGINEAEGLGKVLFDNTAVRMTVVLQINSHNTQISRVSVTFYTNRMQPEMHYWMVFTNFKLKLQLSSPIWPSL